MARFLLTTFGSLGDLHPYIAVGRGLRARGHSAAIATSEIYRAKVEGEGLGFHPVRPELAGVLDHPEIMRRAFHPVTGTLFIVRDLFLPYLDGAFEDTLAAAREADVIVSHPLAFAVAPVSEILRKPWVSVALAPGMMLSAFDPPPLPGLPFPGLMQRLGPGFWRPMLNLARQSAPRLGRPVNRLRQRLGLAARKNPIFDDLFSPWGTHAWFSKLLGAPQPDWPVPTTVTGFPFYDRLEPGQTMSPELHRFLAAGPPPVVFTLGSAAVFDARDFYTESAEAARLAGLRAILLTGLDPRNQPARPLPDSILATEYAPYSELFPRAAATVHQGGIGTTAQALRAGKPMIVVPFSHDQPDNARRAARLGLARVMDRHHYTAERAARNLRELLSSEACRSAAANAARAIAAEDGVGAACAALEAVFLR